jgi:hypothetical protein
VSNVNLYTATLLLFQPLHCHCAIFLPCKQKKSDRALLIFKCPSVFTKQPQRESELSLQVWRNQGWFSWYKLLQKKLQFVGEPITCSYRVIPMYKNACKQANLFHLGCCRLRVFWFSKPFQGRIKEYVTHSLFTFFGFVLADPSGRAVSEVGLRPLACWDCGFESRRGTRISVCYECCILSEVLVSDWSLLQRSPTEFGVPN